MEIQPSGSGDSKKKSALGTCCKFCVLPVVVIIIVFLIGFIIWAYTPTCDIDKELLAATMKSDDSLKVYERDSSIIFEPVDYKCGLFILILYSM